MTPDANALDVKKARESFQRFVDLAFGNAGPRPRLSIPADPERDDDLIVSAALDRLAALEAENARLRAVAEKARAFVAAEDALEVANRRYIDGGGGAAWDVADVARDALDAALTALRSAIDSASTRGEA